MTITDNSAGLPARLAIHREVIQLLVQLVFQAYPSVFVLQCCLGCRRHLSLAGRTLSHLLYPEHIPLVQHTDTREDTDL